MISTRPSDDILEFIAFMTESMGPEAAQARAGATESEIEQLIKLARLPLPALYIGYLREFGHENRPLLVADDSDARISTLIKFYMEQEHSMQREIPINGATIGLYGIDGNITLLYPMQVPDRLGASQIPGEPTVVWTWDDEVADTYAQTFRNHLYRQAFLRGRLREGALFGLRKHDDDLLFHAKPVVMQLGFVPYWFNDDYQICLERSDGSVLYIQRTPKRNIISGCFRDEAARNQVKANLVRELGLHEAIPDSVVLPSNRKQ